MTFNEPLYLVDGWGTREWDYVWTRNFRLEEEDSLSQARDMPFFDIAGVCIIILILILIF